MKFLNKINFKTSRKNHPKEEEEQEEMIFS